MEGSFDPDQEAGLREDLEGDGPPQCPVCGIPLHRTPVPPRGDVSYVRHRVLLECGSCGRRAVLDQRG